MNRLGVWSVSGRLQRRVVPRNKRAHHRRHQRQRRSRGDALRQQRIDLHATVILPTVLLTAAHCVSPQTVSTTFKRSSAPTPTRRGHLGARQETLRRSSTSTTSTAGTTWRYASCHRPGVRTSPSTAPPASAAWSARRCAWWATAPQQPRRADGRGRKRRVSTTLNPVTSTLLQIGARRGDLQR
jgi:hypothetical protein